MGALYPQPFAEIEAWRRPWANRRSKVAGAPPVPPMPTPVIDLAFSQGSYDAATLSFTRATEATVIDNEGIVRYCLSGEMRLQGLQRVQNLAAGAATDSLSVANGWNTYGTTIPPGPLPNTATDPLGGTTATTVGFPAIGPGDRSIFYTNDTQIVGRTYTWSVWVRGTATTPTGTCYVNLQDGVTINANGSIAFDGTWRRVWITYTATSTGHGFAIGPDTFTGSTQPGTQPAIEVAVWGYQFEEAASMGGYASKGVVAGPAYHGAFVDAVKYFNVTRGASPTTIPDSDTKGYLDEESRTNLILNSVLSGAAGGAPGVAPTSWSYAPFGTPTTALATVVGLPAISFTVDASSRILCQQTISVAAATTYVFSVYIDVVVPGLPAKQILLAFGSFGSSEYFLDGVSIGASSVEVPLGVHKLSYVFTTTIATPATFRIGAGVNSALLAGTVNITAPQLELTTFPSSYIPTDGSAVTRNADVLEYTPPGSYDSTLGTWAIAATARTNTNMLTPNAGGQSFLVTSGGKLRAEQQVGASAGARGTFTGVPTVVDGALAKLALSWDVAGATRAASFSGAAPPAPTDPGAGAYFGPINIGANDVGNKQINGVVRSLRYYDIAGSQAQLNALTA